MDSLDVDAPAFSAQQGVYASVAMSRAFFHTFGSKKESVLSHLGWTEIGWRVIGAVEVWQRLDRCFRYYNFERLHQALGYTTTANEYFGDSWQLQLSHKDRWFIAQPLEATSK